MASLIIGFGYLYHDVGRGRLRTLCESNPKVLQGHETYLVTMAASLSNLLPDLHLENERYDPRDVAEITLQITSLSATVCFLVGVNYFAVCCADSKTLKYVWDSAVISTQTISTVPSLWLNVRWIFGQRRVPPLWRARRQNVMWGSCFLALHLYTAVVWYGFVYDSDLTYMPWWKEYLV